MLNKKDIAVLESIKTQISATHWTTGAYHRTINWDTKHSKDLYCLVGFVNKETHTPLRRESNRETDPIIALAEILSPSGRRRKRLIKALRETTGFSHLEAWNDETGREREDVLAMLDFTIQRETKGKPNGAASDS